jgi:dUTP pyrophosphatase
MSNTNKNECEFKKKVDVQTPLKNDITMSSKEQHVVSDSACCCSAVQIIGINKVTEYATMPIKKNPGDAAYDLTSAYDGTVPGGKTKVFKTDLIFVLPNTHWAEIKPRSGLSVKSNLTTDAGVIDSGYRGNVGVVLYNKGTEDFDVKRGDRIAQVVFKKHEIVTLVPCDDLWVQTERSDGGFGSTGVSSTKK